MPYHLEKGPTIRLLEQHLNGSAEEMRAMLDALRNSENSVDWVVSGIPGLWDDPRFAHSPLGSGAAVQENLIRNWLGFEQVGGAWQPGNDPTTGYWVAYQGDVNEIVRRTLTWALEQSLGLAPDDAGAGRDDPWEIEVFWKCPTPWFEGWVVTRPIDGRADDDDPEEPDLRKRRLDPRRRRWHRWHHHHDHEGSEPAGDEPRGLVTVIFMTPSHLGANVAESPIAHSATTLPPGVTHAIPSWQDDYEVLGEPHPDLTGFPGRPKIAPPNERAFSSWIVTHRDHQTVGQIDVTTNTAAAADFADWGIPLLSIYAGQGDIVIVSPSVAAGGIPADGVI
jgi:hypothetical protein